MVHITVENLMATYLLCNSFATGYLHGKNGFGKGFVFLFYALAGICFALPLIALTEIKDRWPSVRSYLHLYFWFPFWFTQKWDHLTEEQIEGLLYRYSVWKNKTTSRARIYRFVMRLIFKRNGITDYSPTKNTQDKGHHF